MTKLICAVIFVVASIELGGMGVDKLLSTAQAEHAAFIEAVDQHREY
jgi:hypothetical protein